MSGWRDFDADAHQKRVQASITRIGRAQENERIAATWNGNVEPAIILPWPPTGNTAVRHGNGAHYLRPEVTAYRLRVASILAPVPPIAGAYELEVELSPPDKRARDIDNALKSLLDACVKSGWLPSDAMSHMRRLLVTVLSDYRGLVFLRALPAPKAAA